MIRNGAAGLIAAALLIASETGAAQQWSVDAQAGRVRAALDPSAQPSESAVLGVRYDSPDAGLRLSAGFPLSSGQQPWGSLVGWNRLAWRRGGFVLGVDGMASLFAVSELREATAAPSLPGAPVPGGSPPKSRGIGHAFAVQLLPVFGYEISRAQLQLRVGTARYRAEIGGATSDRSLTLADAQLSVSPMENVIVTPVVRRFQAAGEDAAIFAGISAATVIDRATIWGSAGQWSGADAARGTSWGAGGSLRVMSRVSVIGSVRHEPHDPISLGAPYTSWNAGISLQVGGGPARAAAPVPATYRDGMATVRIGASAVRGTPRIAGDFNGWKPAPMRRDGGWWIYDVALQPGVYNYAFVDESGSWFVPEGTPGRRDDGMGGHVAVLVVR